MSTSDTIASLALVVALISFWLSYRAARLSNRVAAAEKRTQAYSVLVGTLLEAQSLHALVRSATEYKGKDVTFPTSLKDVEAQLADMTANITKRLEWLRGKGSDDPVSLEEYKAYVLEVDSRIKQVAPMIRGLEVRLKEPKTN
jgi:hypothetical protein